MRRPRKPDLAHGDEVLIQAHHWVDTGAGRICWLPSGGYRRRLIARIAWDKWCGWQVMSEPTAPHHPSREAASEIVAVLRARPRPGAPDPVAPAPLPAVQLGLFEVAS